MKKGQNIGSFERILVCKGKVRSCESSGHPTFVGSSDGLKRWGSPHAESLQKVTAWETNRLPLYVPEGEELTHSGMYSGRSLVPRAATSWWDDAHGDPH